MRPKRQAIGLSAEKGNNKCQPNSLRYSLGRTEVERTQLHTVAILNIVYKYTIINLFSYHPANSAAK
jgi:hypothetical protein